MWKCHHTLAVSSTHTPNVLLTHTLFAYQHLCVQARARWEEELSNRRRQLKTVEPAELNELMRRVFDAYCDRPYLMASGEHKVTHGAQAGLLLARVVTAWASKPAYAYYSWAQLGDGAMHAGVWHRPCTMLSQVRRAADMALWCVADERDRMDAPAARHAPPRQRDHAMHRGRRIHGRAADW